MIIIKTKTHATLTNLGTCARIVETLPPAAISVLPQPPVLRRKERKKTLIRLDIREVVNMSNLKIYDIVSILFKNVNFFLKQQ